VAIQGKHKVYTEQNFDHLKDLDGLSNEQIGEHLQLYSGYVPQVNALNEELGELKARGRASGRDHDFAELTRRLGFEYNGMILHEYYFSGLKAGAEPKPPTTLRLTQALADSFGSVTQWRDHFQAIGSMRGIGWVLLCQDPVTQSLSNHWVTLHHVGVPASFKPLLVLDVWEHAFMRDYKATEKSRYLEAFFRNIDWQTVERRLRDTAATRRAAAA